MVSSKRCFTSYDNVGDRSWDQFRRLNVQNPAGLYRDLLLEHILHHELSVLARGIKASYAAVTIDASSDHVVVPCAGQVTKSDL